MLIGLTIEHKAPDGTADKIVVRFKQYGRRDKMPRPDAESSILLELEPQSSGDRVLWRDATAYLRLDPE